VTIIDEDGLLKLVNGESLWNTIFMIM
jgi:hypothetical protein